MNARASAGSPKLGDAARSVWGKTDRKGTSPVGWLPLWRHLADTADVAGRLRAEHGVSHLLLGCTELSFAIQGERWLGFTVVDPVKVLAQYCLARAGLVERKVYSIAA